MQMTWRQLQQYKQRGHVTMEPALMKNGGEEVLARQITDSARKSQNGDGAVDAMARDLQSLLRCCCSSVGLLLPPLYLSLERYLMHCSDAHRVHDVTQLVKGRIL